MATMPRRASILSSRVHQAGIVRAEPLVDAYGGPDGEEAGGGMHEDADRLK